MGTRARVNVFDGETLILSIYNHWDGYPSGLGKKLAHYLGNMTIGNGGSGPEKYGSYANGMGCFAAQLVTFLKDGNVGCVYIRDQGADSHGEEFTYNLSEGSESVDMEVKKGSVTMFGRPGSREDDMKTIFKGSAAEFIEFINKEDAG